ncbi:DUF2393 domain-containing protein [Campylobacter lari]|uniref:DUF2393 family protein n=1 Tax=Campylobacter lari TaxID=201 RepID=UPI0008C2CB6D|nr:DUF2393 family protein [Campylobacter lari]EAJ0334086.1 DUF2393 domain-containing protein [Campylobacter lari]EAJ0334636.1 DUF2393 domain-containing protein [Campylobacter lari]MCV3366817.1 DUF2393 domain-containing protein [Campylobacter lari]MCV3372938.1 DUF2393 domain-containing protein [Campylobacter lari]MCV3389177.1 DUF2393 domain-containing protein [Campylobacter lari]
MGYFTIFHILIIVIMLASTGLTWVLLYLKVQNKKYMIIFCAVSFILALILTISLLLTIDQYTKKASLSNFSTYRRLATESIIVKGRVTNDTNFKISECFLELRIIDDNKKHEVSGEIFNQQNFDSIKRANQEQRDVSYNINIVKYLPGNTYKDFSFEVALPPQFQSYKVFKQLKCR